MFHYSDSLKKPILFPIHALDGTELTRGYPLTPRPGEQIDHLHHTGHWFNHGMVNGVDFWSSTWESHRSGERLYGAIDVETVGKQEYSDRSLLKYSAY